MNFSLKIKGFRWLTPAILTIFKKFYCLYFKFSSNWNDLLSRINSVFY